jgi:hypothetical protein
MSTSVSEVGRELIAEWKQIERGVAEWVLKLADFDASGVWREDGFASCVSWLVTKCDLARSTAHEKLKVAHELSRRFIVRDAFAGGMSYTKVRILVRLKGVNHERDEEFVAHAASDSVRVLNERVDTWNYYNTQDAKPVDLDDHYGIRRSRGFGGGLGKLVIEAPDDMLDRLYALLDAYGRFLYYNDKPEKLGLADVEVSATQTPAYDDVESDVSATQTPPPDGVTVLQARAYDDDETPKPLAGRSLSARRLDWLFDLLEEVALSEPKKIDPYVATVGVTIQYEDLINNTGAGYSSQGSTPTGEAVRQLCCHAGIHRIVVKGQSEILDFGREQRLYDRTVARAIRFRHGHTCCVKGCDRRITFIHHVDWWENGGETNIDDGVPKCAYHHHLGHEGGWKDVWDPATGLMAMIGPKGQVLETTASFFRAA